MSGDDRLDGPDSPILISCMAIFPHQPCVILLRAVLPDHTSGSIEVHKGAVKRRLARWRTSEAHRVRKKRMMKSFWSITAEIEGHRRQVNIGTALSSVT